MDYQNILNRCYLIKRVVKIKKYKCQSESKIILWTIKLFKSE